MDILRNEFTKYDSTRQGSVSAEAFRSVLHKFGVGQGVNAVVNKFSRDNKINYDEFLRYFENSKRVKSTQKSDYTALSAAPLVHKQVTKQQQPIETTSGSETTNSSQNNKTVQSTAHSRPNERNVQDKLFRFRNVLEKKFKSVDSQNTGFVSRQDFEEGLKECGFDHTGSISSISGSLTNRSDKVDYDHFLSLIHPDASLKTETTREIHVPARDYIAPKKQVIKNNNNWKSAVYTGCEGKVAKLRKKLEEHDYIRSGYLDKTRFEEAVRELRVVPDSVVTEISRDVAENDKVDYNRFVLMVMDEERNRFASTDAISLQQPEERNAGTRTSQTLQSSIFDKGPDSSRSISGNRKGSVPGYEFNSESPTPESYDPIMKPSQTKRFASPTYDSDVFNQNSDIKLPKTGRMANYHRLSSSFTKTGLAKTNDDLEIKHLRKRIRNSQSTKDKLLEQFQSCDEDADGYVSRIEFKTGMQQLGIPFTQSHLEAVESLFDSERKGKIYYPSFVEAVSSGADTEIQDQNELLEKRPGRKHFTDPLPPSDEQKPKTKKMMKEAPVRTESKENPLAKRKDAESQDLQDRVSKLENIQNQIAVNRARDAIQKNRNSKIVQSLFEKLDEYNGVTVADLKQTLTGLGLNLSNNEFNSVLSKCTNGSSIIDYESFDTNILRAPNAIPAAMLTNMSSVVGMTKDEILGTTNNYNPGSRKKRVAPVTKILSTDPERTIQDSSDNTNEVHERYESFYEPVEILRPEIVQAPTTGEYEPQTSTMEYHFEENTNIRSEPSKPVEETITKPVPQRDLSINIPVRPNESIGESSIEEQKNKFVNRRIKSEIEEATQGKPIKLRESFRVFDTAKSNVLPEEAFRKALKSVSKDLPRWIVDRAVRVSKSDNGLCHYEKFINQIGLELPDDISMFSKGAYDPTLRTSRSTSVVLTDERADIDTAPKRSESPRYATRPRDSGDIIGHTTPVRSREDFIEFRASVPTYKKTSGDILSQGNVENLERKPIIQRESPRSASVESPRSTRQSQQMTYASSSPRSMSIGRYSSTPRNRNPILSGQEEVKLFDSKKKINISQSKEQPLFPVKKKVAESETGVRNQHSGTFFTNGSLVVPESTTSVTSKRVAAYQSNSVFNHNPNNARDMFPTHKKRFTNEKNRTSFVPANVSVPLEAQPLNIKTQMNSKPQEQNPSKSAVLSKIATYTTSSRQAFRYLDKDRDGSLSVNDIQKGLRGLNLNLSKQNIREAFNVSDSEKLDYETFSKRVTANQQSVGITGLVQNSPQPIRTRQNTEGARRVFDSSIGPVLKWMPSSEHEGRSHSAPRLSSPRQQSPIVRGHGDIIAWRNFEI